MAMREGLSKDGALIVPARTTGAPPMARHDNAPPQEEGDRALLAQFTRSRDEAAFAQLVVRHGCMVFGVCQRVLRNRHDAEDAFQATFLVLAQSARRIRRKRSLASWLYGVAYRISLRISRDRRRHSTSPLKAPIMIREDPLQNLTLQFQQGVVDAELNRLPECLRLPLVLRYLCGNSNEEVARHMNLTVAAVEGRLKRAKAKLRMRLARRGVALGLACVVMERTAISAGGSQLEPLFAATIQVCCKTPTVHGAAADVVLPRSHQLARQEILSMTVAKLSRITTVLLIAASAAVMSVTPWYWGRLASAGQADGQVVLQDTQPASDNPFGVVGSSENNHQTAPPQGGASDANLTPKDEPAAATDADPRAPAERRITEELNRQTSIHFFDVPLSEVINQLEQLHRIPIELDSPQVLRDEGIDTEAPINRQLEGITLKSALNLILRDLNLTYIVRDEVLLITTWGVAKAYQTVRIYRIDPRWSVTPDELVDLIDDVVAPNTWEEIAGQEGGTIRAVGNALVVRQSQAVHEQIEDFLGRLREFFATEGVK